MQVYLLDTCAISALADVNHSAHHRILRYLSEIDAPMAISSISIGEIEYGICCNPEMPLEKQEALRRTVDTYRHVAPTRYTAKEYARLRAWLFENKSPTSGRKGRRVSQLVDPDTDLMLQVQENDLWIASQALEMGAIWVTDDASNTLKKAADGANLPLKIHHF